MSKTQQFALTVLAISIGAAAGYAGYVVMSKKEHDCKFIGKIKEALQHTQEKADQMSEEVALKTAKLTNNPKVNQSWVEKQWSEIGY